MARYSARTADWAASCEDVAGRLEPDQADLLESPMTAILAILAFVVVIAALNRYEYGSFD
jgi:hypothetical protein